MESSVFTPRSPLLNEKNYSYWKVRVKAYFKALNEKAWGAILIGWSPSIVTTNEFRTTKSEKIWTKAEKNLTHINFKVRNAIISFVDFN